MTNKQAAVCISLAFVGGAVAGAAAVYASNPENRKRLRKTLESSRRMAARVPDAIQEVKAIANDAMNDVRENAKDTLSSALSDVRENAKDTLSSALSDARDVARDVAKDVPVSPALRNAGRA